MDDELPRQVSLSSGSLIDAHCLKAMQALSGKSRGRRLLRSGYRQEPHTVITNIGDLDHRTNSNIMKLSKNAIGPQVTTRDSLITKENTMSRRGIHPLLMGLDRPERSVAPRHPLQTSGLESAQRKRYLRSEAEKRETSTPVEA